MGTWWLCLLYACYVADPKLTSRLLSLTTFAPRLNDRPRSKKVTWLPTERLRQSQKVKPHTGVEAATFEKTFYIPYYLT